MAADMFTIPANAMKGLVEFLDENPISYTYPHAQNLAELAAVLAANGPISETLTDFINHVGSQTQQIGTEVKNAEYMAQRISDYDETDSLTSFKSMYGSLHEDFAKTLQDWTVRAANPSNHASIYNEMNNIIVGEPAAFNRARQVLDKITEASRLMRIVESAASGDASSIAGKILNAALPANIKNAIQTAQNIINGLQQVAEFGFGGDTPGQEFKQYLEKTTQEVQSALQNGVAKMVNGALQISQTVEGALENIPEGIVEQMLINFPEFQETLDKVENIVKQGEEIVSTSAALIEDVKKELGV